MSAVLETDPEYVQAEDCLYAPETVASLTGVTKRYSNGVTVLTREGNGLRGMRERVESVGGHLALEQENGTRLLIELPWRVEAMPS